MPLIEPVARCRKFAKLSRAGGWFYLQLKTILDPLGRHDADAQILASALFPLRKDARPTDITLWLAECKSAGLLRLFVDTRSRSVVEVFDAVQHRMTSRKSQHNEIPDQPEMVLLDEADSKKVVLKKPPPGGKRKEEKGILDTHPPAGAKAKECPEHSEAPFADGAIPTLEEVLRQAGMSAVTEESARAFYNHHEDNSLWINQHGRLIHWRKKLISWQATDRKMKTNEKHGPNSARYRGGAPSRITGTLNKSSTYAGIKNV